MGLSGSWQGAFARKATTALVASVLFTLFVGVSWGASGYSPDSDPYSMANVTSQTGAQACGTPAIPARASTSH